jgi:hypothetical protein
MPEVFDCPRLHPASLFSLIQCVFFPRDLGKMPVRKRRNAALEKFNSFFVNRRTGNNRIHHAARSSSCPPLSSTDPPIRHSHSTVPTPPVRHSHATIPPPPVRHNNLLPKVGKPPQKKAAAIVAAAIANDTYVGNQIPVQRLRGILKSHFATPSKSTGVLIRGPAGCGKTLLVQQLARELDSKLVVFGPGNLTTQNSVDVDLFSALTTNTLGKKRRIVVIDTVEAIRKFDSLLSLIRSHILLEKKKKKKKKKKKNEVAPMEERRRKMNPLIIIGTNSYNRKVEQIAKLFSTIMIPKVTSYFCRQIIKNHGITGVTNEDIISSDGDVRNLICQGVDEKDSLHGKNIFEGFKLCCESPSNIDGVFEKYRTKLVDTVFKNYPSRTKCIASASQCAELFSEMDIASGHYMSRVNTDNIAALQRTRANVVKTAFSYMSPSSAKIMYSRTTIRDKKLDSLLSLSSILRRSGKRDILMDEVHILETYRHPAASCLDGDSFLFKIPSSGLCYSKEVLGDKNKSVRVDHKLVFNSAKRFGK